MRADRSYEWKVGELRVTYSADMSVAQLSRLAAYAVVMAGEMDPLCVAGLDMAIYRDSLGRFEFTDKYFLFRTGGPIAVNCSGKLAFEAKL